MKSFDITGIGKLSFPKEYLDLPYLKEDPCIMLLTADPKTTHVCVGDLVDPGANVLNLLLALDTEGLSFDHTATEYTSWEAFNSLCGLQPLTLHLRKQIKVYEPEGHCGRLERREDKPILNVATVASLKKHVAAFIAAATAYFERGGEEGKINDSLTKLGGVLSIPCCLPYELLQAIQLLEEPVSLSGFPEGWVHPDPSSYCLLLRSYPKQTIDGHEQYVKTFAEGLNATLKKVRQVAMVPKSL